MRKRGSWRAGAGAAGVGAQRAAMGFALRAALVWIVASLLAGCASLTTLFEPIRDEPAAEAVDETAPQGPPEADVYRLEIVAPEPLLSLFERHLDLARFRDARVAGAVTPLELDRLIAGAPAQARALAETEGYFDAQVSASRDRAEVPLVRVVVDPGPRALVSSVAFSFEGPLQVAAAAGDDFARRTMAMVEDRWPLAEGAGFSQSAWSGAKNGTLARLQGAGYALARWRDTSATVDVARHSVALTLVAESGPLFRIGHVSIEGLTRYEESAILNLLDFEPGEPYSEDLLASWQRHLQRSELFEAASVTLLVEADHADDATVLVKVKEHRLQQATLGLGYSTDTGPRMTLDHMHRRPFGQDVTVTNRLELGGAKNAWTGQVISHPLPNHYRNLVSAGYERLDLNDEFRTSGNVRLGRTQDTDDFARQYFIAVQGAKVESAAPTTSAWAATLNYNAVLRRIDSIALPTRGWVLSAETAAGYSFHTTASNGTLARLLGRVTAYRPLSERLFMQGYVELGQVFARSETGIPDTLLFRAGGIDSVRGYDYRSLGPVVNGVVTSGRMLFTSSIELAGPISDRFPTLWGAVFVDAGNAANQWSDLKPVFGVGPGIRWRSPVGALRVDLAYAIEDRRWRLEVSLGIAP
ncbi:MAG TPA: BamA/TamA family outer membrane protein [Burkholderiaceae bacterium]|nr:BamA/TamA family outer membrane protein [Burkholderiaceae bacterium]